MKEIVKHLTVHRLEMRHRMEGKYLLGLIEPETWDETESTLTLMAEDMIRFCLDPSEDLVGATLSLTLKPVRSSPETAFPDVVLIERLLRSTQVQPHYYHIPPDKSERLTCRLEAKTPAHAGTLVILPSTYYELNLRLTESEYRFLRALPAGTALQAQLRQTDRPFRDVTLKYRATLDNPRIFPKDYAARMITLARAMIAYCDGDVDYVGHYCGLELHEEHDQADDNARPSMWRWRREYFAVDSLSPDEWEAAFTGSVARVDAILKKRYRNRLPSGPTREFYDHIETSTWMSKQPHPVHELSVGVEANCVLRGHHYVPTIVIEARSVPGNRKACEVACETLSQAAARLFQVRFDYTSLDIGESRDEPQAPRRRRRRKTRQRRGTHRVG